MTYADTLTCFCKNTQLIRAKQTYFRWPFWRISTFFRDLDCYKQSMNIKLLIRKGWNIIGIVYWNKGLHSVSGVFIKPCFLWHYTLMWPLYWLFGVTIGVKESAWMCSTKAAGVRFLRAYFCLKSLCIRWFWRGECDRERCDRYSADANTRWYLFWSKCRRLAERNFGGIVFNPEAQ